MWKIAADTVARIPALYDRYGYGVLEEWLPAPFFDLQLFDVQLWQWLGLVLVGAVGLGVSWLLSRGALKILVPLTRRSVTTIDDELLENGAPRCAC